MSNLQSDVYENTQHTKDLKKDIQLSSIWNPIMAFRTPYAQVVDNVIFNAPQLDFSKLPAMLRLEKQVIFAAQSANTALYTCLVSRANILSKVNLDTYANTQHQYLTLAACFKFHVIGSPLANGVFAITFVPTGSSNGLDTSVVSTAIDKVNMTRSILVPICQNSVHEMVVPFNIPWKYLQSVAFHTDQICNWIAGDLGVYMITNVEIKDTSNTKPSLSIYTSAMVTYGGDRYLT